MMRLFLLMGFLLAACGPGSAQEESNADRKFTEELDKVKNPFDDGLPKPVVAVPKPPVLAVKPFQETKPVVTKPVVIPPPVELPEMRLIGVMVGDGIHEAIIDDQVVTLNQSVQGAKIISVSKEGVGLLYKGKKFFLKVE